MSENSSAASKVSWLPVLGWIRTYSAQNARVDAVAGVSLAAYAIPVSIAYASLANLPPVTGLYCYLIAGIVYVWFGTSRQLAIGPTSAMSIVVAASVAAMAAGDPVRAVAIGSAVALMMGIIAVAGRFVGLANAAYFLSDAILVGFKTGAALYIASTQLPKLFGISGVSGNFFERIAHVIWHLPDTHGLTLAVGLAALVLFLVFERIFPGRPTTLVVVAAAILAVTAFGLGEKGVKIVGEIPTGLPAIGVPQIKISDLGELIPVAFACFLLAYGESISVARTFAQKNGYNINPEQELTAIGASNIATGLAHGYPVAGGMSQTAVNAMSGASSPFALVVTSSAIALTLLFFAGFLRNLPDPVLAAIVLMAASQLVRIEEIRQLRLVSRREFYISLIALVGVLCFGLLHGLLLAAIGSLIMVIAKASRPNIAILGRDPATGQYVNRARHPSATKPPAAMVVRSAGAWFYFNVDYIRQQITELIDNASPGIRTLVIDCSIVPAIDPTAGTTLRTMVRSLAARGIKVVLAELRDDVVENLKAVGAEADLGPIVARRTIAECLDQPR